ncbi:MAG: hypothetical protein ACRD2G_19005, partial [Terriglobia bacterium]
PPSPQGRGWKKGITPLSLLERGDREAVGEGHFQALRASQRDMNHCKGRALIRLDASSAPAIFKTAV